MILNCFSCGNATNITDKTFFCPKCLKQIVCKTCSEPLIKDAIGCIACGTPILDFAKPQLKLNEIEFEQKGDTKKFKASFTDVVGHDLVATFGGLVGIGNLPRKKSLGIILPKSTMELQLKNGEDIEAIEELDDDDFSEILNSVLKMDGDGLVFQTVNFKTTKTLNREIRIALLTLLGYKYLHNAEEVKRSKITEALKKFKLGSSAFRSWITKSEEIGQKSGGLVFLTPNGLKSSIEILKEVINPNVNIGLIDFSKTRIKRKKGTGDDGDETKKGSGKSPKEYVMKLVSEGFFQSKRNSSDIIQHLKVNHAAVFKTPAITTVLGRLITDKTLKREKGESGKYVYFI
ncbi:zinc ribbon domain-containing protein [Pedobacter jejuensis]|uniref:Zinc ribbon domain-containing protein n=1 Tax=Pedobacter jejuensis TaxID=1268550 RepID=A0A3N0BM67_9SPHI|nr:zinc ribbon domain-containing protein [Pedobacter jejuensis]RNL49764.1 zinc ribbon domain-containing protein [Pedobacter jejuensis]